VRTQLPGMSKTLWIAAATVMIAGRVFGQAACDRACLEGFVDTYMDALIAHDPKHLPVTPKMKMTENGQRLEPGDGFWRTATAKGTYRLFAADVAAGKVAFLGTMKEANIPVMVAIRLTVDNRKVAEIETFVVRNEAAATNLDKLGKPNPLFLQPVPSGERASREDLVKTANLYFSGLQKNDGKGTYPFTDDCNRTENGIQTTNNPNFRTSSLYAAPAPTARGGQAKQAPPPAAPEGPQMDPASLSCKAAFESGYYRFVTRIRDRRFVVVDSERGLVFSFVFLDHAAGKNRIVKLKDGKEITAGPSRPWTWEAAELFKIEKGKIRQVEAIMEQVPYGMLSGWSDWTEGMSTTPR
jgi:hypothetical protein